MRVVLDTNIFIAALMSHEGLAFQSLKLWTEKRYDLVTSNWQIEELRRVSQYDKVKLYVTASEVGTLVNALRKKALVWDDVPEVAYSPDPNDNPILSAAITGQVQYVVSGDKGHILHLETVKGIKVMTLRDFVGRFVNLEN
ncbi:MAG: putative toxin-antitoxin system toxin component, PIN family [Trueperaceae bacterium]